jgi:serine/threonine-protein kinase
MPRIGDVLNTRYRLDQLIGYGGAAVVYRGFDLKSHHHVAIKVLLFDRVNGGSDFNGHLRDEARAAMRLSHPFIARVFKHDRQGSWEYLVMEFVSGQNLNVLSRARPNGRLEIRETINVGLDVLDALGYAHQQGVIHNDIKPRNILVDQRNEVKLCDFGLSRLTDFQASRSFKTVLGTAAYISPERLQGRPANARSDLYSLGATLFKISVGRPPFRTRSNKTDRGYASDRRDTLPKIPRAFKAVLSKALKKDPNARFASAAEMSEALLEVLHNRISVPQISSKQHTKHAFKPESVPSEQQVQHRRSENKPPTDMVWTNPGSIEYEGKDFDINGFYLDRTPVTNKQYAEFIDANSQLPPLWWAGAKPPEDKLDHPVVGITIAQARLYAAWCNKRLPTTLEWVCALYGTDKPRISSQRVLQETAKISPQKAGNYAPQISRSGTSPVGKNDIDSPNEGFTDLLGNVWEWTEVDDRFPPSDKDYFYVMGGSYLHPPGDDDAIPRTTVSQFGEYRYLGFRCARDKD